MNRHNPTPAYFDTESSMPGVSSNPLLPKYYRSRTLPTTQRRRLTQTPQIVLSISTEPKSWRTNPVPSERFRLIQERAYFKAKRRGFIPGHEVEDWLEAEREFDSGENFY